MNIGDLNPIDQKVRKYNNLNIKLLMLEEAEDPPSEIPIRKLIFIKGRKEHEDVLKDAAQCKELGLDQAYETMVYLNRWSGWLGD